MIPILFKPFIITAVSRHHSAKPMRNQRKKPMGMVRKSRPKRPKRGATKTIMRAGKPTTQKSKDIKMTATASMDMAVSPFMALQPKPPFQ